MAETRLCAPHLSAAGWLIFIGHRGTANDAAGAARQGAAYA